MPFLLRNLKLQPGKSEELLLERLKARFSLRPEDITAFRVARKGIDARRKQQIMVVYAIEFTLADESGFAALHMPQPDLEFVQPYIEQPLPRLNADRRIVIAGMGPAGLFAALRLSGYGLIPTLLERGKATEERIRDVRRFWETGEFDAESNVQFGEGGAGTFSDGKLTTRVRDPRIGYVLAKLVEFGAPPEIRYLAKPHVGSDRLRMVVMNMRRHLEANGVTVRFGRQVTDLITGAGRLKAVLVNDRDELACDALLLACGHSARDTYRMLARRGVRLEQKPFAVGLRVEHPQELINRIQYGLAAHPHLPPADYSLVWNDEQNGRAAYSFCMCPGGVIVAGSSEPGGVVTNGMSAYLRDSPHANSALVVTVGERDFGGDSPLAGVEFQRAMERAAFTAGGSDYHAPVQNLLAFLGDRKGGSVDSSYRPGVREADLARLLPAAVTTTLREGVRHFERKMRGFITSEATLTGVETRTSAPLRIVRGEDLQSVNLSGLYPTGEGAGYAGGIMSAALDGIRVADAIARSLSNI